MRRIPLWAFVTGGVAVLLGVAVAVASVTPLDYLAFEPGPVYAIDDFVEVGDETSTLNGESFMLTVVYSDVTVLDALVAGFDPAVDLVAREAVRPTGVSDEEFRAQSLRSMEQSKQTAVYVALTRLGYDVEISGEGVSVEAVIEGTGAQGVLQVGDVVTSINGVQVRQHPEAVTEIFKHAVGDVLLMRVIRGVGTESEEELDLEVELVEHTQEAGRPMVGFLAGTYNWGFSSPVDVTIDSGNIGGPSAGLMYTLTILDLLSDEDLLGGRVIAGSGTIDRFGAVGPIGGIRQKVVAAARQGAEVVFVPEANWDDALSAPVDVELVKVATIDDALAWLGASAFAATG